MNDEISDEMIRTTLLARTGITDQRVSEIGARLRHVTEMLGQLDSPPCAGEFIMVIKDGTPQFWYFLQKDTNSVGRSESCDVSLDDTAASREHCVVRRIENDWEIADCDSRNGFAVNGLKMTHRILCDGDLISIGSYELIFVVNEKIEF